MRKILYNYWSDLVNITQISSPFVMTLYDANHLGDWKIKQICCFYTKFKNVKITPAWEHRDYFPYFSGTISSSHDLLKTSVTVGGGVSDHMSTGSTTSLASYDSMRRLASQVVAYHFCDQSIIDTCQVPEFIHSIAAQLTQSPFLAAYKVGYHCWLF